MPEANDIVKKKNLNPNTALTRIKNAGQRSPSKVGDIWFTYKLHEDGILIETCVYRSVLGSDSKVFESSSVVPWIDIEFCVLDPIKQAQNRLFDHITRVIERAK